MGADVLWPGELWPPMRIDGPGSHGPLKYTVEEYVPSTRASSNAAVNPGGA